MDWGGHAANCLSAHARNSGNKHQNDTRVSAKTIHHAGTYIILLLTRYNRYKKNEKKCPYISTYLTHTKTYLTHQLHISCCLCSSGDVRIDFTYHIISGYHLTVTALHFTEYKNIWHVSARQNRIHIIHGKTVDYYEHYFRNAGKIMFFK